MPKMTVQVQLDRIATAFPPTPLPSLAEMLDFAGDTMGSEFVRESDEFRNQSLDQSTLSLSRLELYYLSPETLKWLMPHYLRSCLTIDSWAADEMIEMLVYFFSPSEEHKGNLIGRLSAFNHMQLSYISAFFERQLDRHEFIFSIEDRVKSAIAFCNEVAQLGRNSNATGNNQSMSDC